MSAEFFSKIFLECAWKASIIPLGNDTTFFALKAFGGHEMMLPLVLAVMGATAGQSFNWLFGKIMAAHKNSLSINEDVYARVARFFSEYGVYLLLFCWLPLCNVLVVMAGFLGIRFRIALPLVLIGEIVNYGRSLIY